MTDQLLQNKELSFLAAMFTAGLCTLFGANAVAIKVSLKGLGVFTTAGLRFTIASATIFLWAWITGRSFSIRKGQIRQLLIITLVFIVQLSLFYLGISKSNASRGTLLLNLQPFFTLFLAHYFIPGDRMGDLMILTGAFLWSCSAVYTKRIIHDFAPFHLVFYPMLFSTPFFFIEGFLWDGSMIAHLDVNIVCALLYQSLITASFAFVAWITMLQKYGAVSLHSFIFIMPVAGVLLGGIVLGEPITPKILIALLLIVSGILVVHFKQEKLVPIFSLGRNV
jgi:drug/metabolite transporter (DMT)-like permease